MRYLHARIIGLALCLMFSLASLASGNLLVERYNISYLDLSNGLPHNNVSDIFKDSNGFLWISTYGGGLVRYDGYSMMVPRLDLNSKSCRSVTEDPFRRLWVAFDEGIDIVDLRTMKSVIPDHPDLKKLLAQSSISCCMAVSVDTVLPSPISRNNPQCGLSIIHCIAVRW